MHKDGRERNGTIGSRIYRCLLQGRLSALQPAVTTIGRSIAWNLGSSIEVVIGGTVGFDFVLDLIVCVVVVAESFEKYEFGCSDREGG